MQNFIIRKLDLSLEVPFPISFARSFGRYMAVYTGNTKFSHYYIVSLVWNIR